MNTIYANSNSGCHGYTRYKEIPLQSMHRYLFKLSYSSTIKSKLVRLRYNSRLKKAKCGIAARYIMKLCGYIVLQFVEWSSVWHLDMHVNRCIELAVGNSPTTHATPPLNRPRITSTPCQHQPYITSIRILNI